MPELRRDPVTGRWVCLAPVRAERPEAPSSEALGLPSSVAGCPFCEGNEESTPPEGMAVRPRGGTAYSPGWSIRVVPSLTPPLSDAVGNAAQGTAHLTSGPEPATCDVSVDHHD